MCKEYLPILKEVKEKEILTDENKPMNILIEGDNYHALSALNYTHSGKIDIIYIDPPYNTGKAKEWKYNDNYVDINDAYRHSKWLNMMEKRLKLAKNLLSINGVLFISIDDNEISQLKLLCENIFNERNFVANIIWQKKFSPQNDAAYFSNMHDYILVFAKKKKLSKNDSIGWNRILLNRVENKSYKNPDNDKRGLWTSGDLTAEGPTENCIYPIISSSGIKHMPPNGKRWVFTKDNYSILLKENRIWFGKKGNSFPRLKRFLSEVQDGYVPNTIWFHDEVGHTQEGKQEFNEFFQREIDFDYPKPSKLIKRIIQIGASKKCTVLDFFAGTGTTGQAVLSLNKDDNGKRKFILCTNNENNICEKITNVRLSKSIKGFDFVGKDKKVLLEMNLTFSDIYRDIKQKKNESNEKYYKRKEEKFDERIKAIVREIDKVILNNEDKYDYIEKEFLNNTIRIIGVIIIEDFKKGLGGNLKYYKTDFIDAKPTDKNKKKLTVEATEMLCIKEDTFEEVKTKNKSLKVFKNGKKYTGVIYDVMSIDDFKDFAKKIDGKFSVYVFSLSDDTYEEEFDDMKNKIKLSPIPEAILRVYRRIFK
ncbi:MAG TPA: site-specific DNA-methyltransferase [Ignavibacteria bacterium]